MLLEAWGDPSLAWDRRWQPGSLHLQLSSHPTPLASPFALDTYGGISYVYFKSQPKDLGQRPLSGDHGPVV